MWLLGVLMFRAARTVLYHQRYPGTNLTVSDPATETLWSGGTAVCTLRTTESRYEVLLRRDGRCVCLLTVESQDAARSLAHKWLILETRRQER